MTARTSGQATGMPSTKNGDWTHYTADVRGTKYSPLDQINASNFNKLEVAWRFKTDNLGTRPEFKLEGHAAGDQGRALHHGRHAPLGGRARRQDRRADLGAQLPRGQPRRRSRRASSRAAASSYWTDGKGDERILYVTTGYRLIALNAKNGAMIPSFGENGIVDLKKGAVYGKGQQIDLETGEIGLHSTPTVVKDVVIVGSSFKEGMTVKTHNNTKGLVRAFDVRTGKLLWTFNTIPQPGRVRRRHLGERVVGDQRQHRRVDADHGRRRSRPRLPAGRDADVGLLRRPSSGQQPVRREPGVRRSEDRPAQVALPVHPSRDLGSRHVVGAAAHRHQRRRQADQGRRGAEQAELGCTCSIASPASRSGRSTRRRCRSRRAGREDVADAADSRPDAPAALRARSLRHVPDDIIDFTPELRAEALENLKRYQLENSPYVPLIRRQRRTACSARINIGNTGGGTNWPGGGLDPETHIFYSQASNSLGDDRIGSIEPPPGFSDIRYVAGVTGRAFRRAWTGPGSAARRTRRSAAGARRGAGAAAEARPRRRSRRRLPRRGSAWRQRPQAPAVSAARAVRVCRS